LSLLLIDPSIVKNAGQKGELREESKRSPGKNPGRFFIMENEIPFLLEFVKKRN